MGGVTHGSQSTGVSVCWCRYGEVSFAKRFVTRALLQLMDAKNPEAAEVIRFWFGSADRDTRWFDRNTAFDDEVRARFLALHGEAAAEKHLPSRDAPRRRRALLRRLDQLPPS